MKKRCFWVGTDKPHFDKYHDEEWGRPSRDDKVHFEFLILESAQAGLSWETILKRRHGYRKAFAGFNAKKVSKYNARKIASLLKDPGIIRNKLKVHAAVSNAKLFLDIQKEFGTFSKYIWSFVGNKTIVNRPRGRGDFKATSPESDALSTDLKQRGFKFTGSTIMYAHMQATGLIDDHEVTCWRKKKK